MKNSHNGTPIYEGKAKILYPGTDAETLIQHFKDSITANNKQKQDNIAGKGIICCLISEAIMQRLTEISLPNHLIKRINNREHLIRRLEMFPIEVVVRNVVAGSLSKRFAIPEGTRLQRSIIEYFYKDDSRNDPMISEEHMTAFGWLGPHDLDDIVAMSLRINDFLQGLFYGVGLVLVDFKLEFGRHYDEYGDARILLGDEISPDTCRLWDLASNERLDKDRFRLDLGRVEDGYIEIARRLKVWNEPIVSQDSKIKPKTAKTGKDTNKS